MSDVDEDGPLSAVDAAKQRHKKEMKDLAARLQKLKHSVPKGDNKRKKEVAAETQKLEDETKARHAAELAAAQKEDASGSKDGANVSESKERGEDDGKPQEDEADQGDGGAVGTGRKPTRAQKRREKKDERSLERQKEIADEKARMGPAARDLERAALVSKLNPLGLRTAEIPPDGHCLYNALSHQLATSGFPESLSFQTLRLRAADYLRSHRDDFMPFLSTDSGDPMCDADYDEYCNSVEKTAAWGGEIEIRALSHLLHVSVEIFQAYSNTILVNEQYAGPKVRLSYHRHEYGLGEHYNSVVAAGVDPGQQQEQQQQHTE
eukprot:Opistho-2@67126